MRGLNRKNKLIVIMLLVLSMIGQIAGPVAENFVYAEGGDSSFRIVDQRLDEGVAYIDWALTLESDDKTNEYSYQSDFNLEEEDLGQPLKTNDGKVIGVYRISKEGKITVEIHEEVYNRFNQVQPKSEDPEGAEADESSEVEDPEEAEEEEESSEAEDLEETEEEDESLEPEDLEETEEEDESPEPEESEKLVKTLTLYGSFEVEGVKEKENLISKMDKMLMGLLGDGPKDLGTIFTSVKLTIDGKEVGDSEGIVDLDEITESMTIGLEFEWELPDNGDDFQLKENDYSSIQLPNIFKGVTGYMSGPLLDDGIEVGTYEISEEGMLKVVFGDHHDFLTKTGRSGTVGFILDFVLEPFEDNSSQEIKFGDPINKTFIIKVRPSGTLASISKSGGPNKDLNADAIDWVIDVNTSLDSLTNAIVKDVIPEGLELEGDIEVYNLNVGINGTLSEGIHKETITSTDTENLEVVLGEIDKAYRIKYTSKITDFSKSSYTNKAELFDGEEIKAESTVTVGKVEQGAAISKKSLTPDKNASSIKWEIDVNKGSETLKNVIIKDELQENLTVKESSIKVFKLNMVDGNWDKGDDVTFSFTPSITNFPLSLGHLEATDVYRIEFETDIEYMDYKETNTFINKAIIKTGKEVDDNTEYEEVGESTASATVYRDPIILKEGKEITSYDSEFPIVEWTIKINGSNHNIYGAVLTDTIGSGLELIGDTIKIYDNLDGDVTIETEEDKYPRILSNENNIMKIGFGDINSSYTIKYQTKIISIDDNTFKNKAELKGTGKHGHGPGGTEIIYDVEKDVTVPPSTVNNSYSKKAVSIDYSEKTMTWKIEIDAVKEALLALTITDTFEDKYMVFIEDGFSVTKGGDELNPATDYYTLTNNNVTGFELEFIEAALGKGKYVIKYKTSFDPDKIIENGGTPKSGDYSIYKNKVKLTGDLKQSVGEGTETLDVDLQDAHTLSQEIYNVGKKEGKLDREAKEITWRIYVNAQSRNLKGSEFKITDTIYEGHSFKDGSLTVQEFTLKSGGNLSVDDENGINLGSTVNPSEYSLDTPSNPFTLTFSDGIDEAYLIEYKTEITGITQKNYKNEAKINDASGEKEYEASVYYKDHNVFITKEALNADKGKVYADDELDWKAVVNESLSEINAAVFEDTISSGHVYVKDSLKVYKGSIAEGNLLTKDDTAADADGKKYKLNVTTNSDETTNIKVDLGNIKGRYIITYNTAVISSTGVITNIANLKGHTFSEESTGIKRFNITKTSWGTASGVSALRGAIKIKKVDDASTAEPVKGAKFNLFYKVNPTDTEWYKVDEVFETGEDGTLTIGNLPKDRVYKLVEVSAPEGYRMKTDETERTREIKVVANTTTEAITSIENERIRDITVKKVWIGPGKNGAKADGMKVKFTLKGNGSEVAGIDPITLTGEPNWEGKFEGLDYYDPSGNEIEYTVEEEIIYPDEESKTPGYKLLTGNPVKSTPDEFGNFNLTFNNKNMEEIEIPVEKVWRKDGDQITPASISVTLSPQHNDNGVGYSYSLTLEKSKDWEAKFSNLIKYDDNGNEIKYKVKEDSIAGYKSVITGSRTLGYTVTNIQLMDIPVTKKWIGTPKKDTVKFTLHEKVGGELTEPAIETLTIDGSGDKTEDATWTGTFEKIPKYKADSDTPIQYGIKEVVPAGFRQCGEISGNQSTGFTVTNMELVDVKVTKNWIGPLVDSDEINIQLYKKVGAGEKQVVAGKTVQVTSDKTQTHTFKDLDKYVVDGSNKTIIDYSVEEDLSTFPGKYENLVTGSGLEYNITNRNIQRISIPVEKIWKVQSPTDIPDSTNIQLSNDQDDVKEVKKLDSTNSWEHTFDNLFKYDQNNGNLITYTIKELDVDKSKFIPEYQGDQNSSDGVKVINIELMDIEVEKKWIGSPKTNVEVSLYEKNGEVLTKVGDSKTLNASVFWKGTFTGIPKYKANGDSITYTVEENHISGYEVDYSGNQVDGFIITNRELIDITGTKEWVNGPSPKPSIKLQLNKNGATEETPIELDGSETTPWSHTWEGLYATDESGSNYTYTVDEVEVPTNYNKTISGDMASGFIITNSYESPKKDITASKKWVDGPSPRPDIWFKLYRKISTDSDYSEVGGAEVKKLTSGVTTVTWTAQAENDINGNPYTYEVKEVDVSGDPLWKPENYVKTENGLEVTNSYNSPTDASLKAVKVWNGGSSPKPTIWFKLYRTTDINIDPVEVPISEVPGAIKELADGITEVSWTGLKKTDIDGKEYKYTIDEVKVPVNYKKSISIDGLTITNKYFSPGDPEDPKESKPKDPDPKDPKDPEDPKAPEDPKDPADPKDPEDPEDLEDPPIIEDNTPKDTPKEGEVEIPEGSIPKVKNPPENGSVTIDEEGKWTYTPNPGFEGKDKFSIKITHPDGSKEEIFYEIDVEVPLAAPRLPITGQANTVLIYLSGLFLIVVGLFLRKRIV